MNSNEMPFQARVQVMDAGHSYSVELVIPKSGNEEYKKHDIATAIASYQRVFSLMELEPIFKNKKWSLVRKKMEESYKLIASELQLLYLIYDKISDTKDQKSVRLTDST